MSAVESIELPEPEKVRGASKRKTIRHLLSFVHGYWRETILTWAMVLVETACEILVAFFTQYVVNSVKTAATGDQTAGLNDLYMYSGIIAGLAILAAVTGIAAGYWAAAAAAGFAKNMREGMFVKIQEYSFRNIDHFSASSIVTRTTTDVTNVQNAFMQIIRAVMRAPFMMIFAIVMCFVTAWQLAWIFLVIVPVVLFLLLFIARFVHPTFEKIFTTYDFLNQEVQENVDGIRVVKSFNREAYQEAKFGKVSEFIYKSFIYTEKILSFNSPIMQGTVFAAILLIAYFCSTIIVESGGTTLDVGTLSTLISYTMMIMMSLMLISMVYVSIIVARNSAERIVEIVEEKPDIVSRANAITEVKDGRVDFNHVSFAYNEGKPVLHDIDLHFAPGSTIGIIGPTGSSKSTLVSLLARLYDVNEGSVEVGGVDVRDYDIKSLRDKVAVVLQKNTLFSGTIRSNLLWGNESASDEELWRALDIAQATSFVKAFPEGLDHPIAEGGTNVSGGQKQRLCIARALLKNPKILILDDSTSACDTHTDSLIRDGLSANRKDVTKFIIAQRVLSVRECDVILVMDEGKIIASGDNETLMANCDVYRELYESQLKGGDFDAAE